MSKTEELGPWKLGQDNVHDRYDGVFRTSRGQQARLAEAINVDMDDDGWPQKRDGTADVLTVTSPRALVSCAGLLLLQNGGGIYRVTPGASPGDAASAEALVTGLDTDAVVQFHEFGGKCYWTNGIESGLILPDGTATNWGLAVPPSPTLGAGAGTLPSAKYRVACTLADARGVESGAPQAAEITTSGGITVDLSSVDANAQYVDIYAARGNMPKLYWAKRVAVGSLPTTVDDVRVSDRTLRNEFLRGPIPGNCLFSYIGYMMIGRDNFVFRSRGQVPHLFHPKSEIMTFADDVRAGAGLRDGFYVATTGGLHWISGSEPAKWGKVIKDHNNYARCVLKLPGEFVDFADTDDEVALFGGDKGLVLAASGGRVSYITDNRLDVSDGKVSGSIVYREVGGIAQIVMLLN